MSILQYTGSDFSGCHVVTELVSSTENSMTPPASAGAVLAGGNEMGELMRAYDWSLSPVGPVDAWPQSLRTAVSILLDSRYPMYIAWGPDFVQFYNDAYRPILGSTKHPAALGRSSRETFPEIWAFIGPMFQRVMESGEATFLEDQLLPLDRYGYIEECYFTFCYSAIRNETGDVGGVFVTCSENTSRVLNDRRLRTLRDLGASSALGRSAEDVAAEAARVLDENPADLPFSLIYLVDENGAARLAASTGIDAGAARCPLAFRVAAPADDGWRFGPLPPSIEVVRGVEERCGTIPARPWPESVRAAAVVPVPRSGQDDALDALLVVGLSPRRAFDEDYRAFIALTARQIGATVSAARAYEAERRRAQVLAELDRAKTTFFSNVSHEFRTPLTLMLGPIDDLLRRPESALSAVDRETLALVQRNGVRLLKLVNTLLDFARIEAGRVQASFEPVDLARFTADLASTFRSAIERAGMRLTVDVADLGEPVYVDPTMWEKVVFNLLSNAFKFTLEGEIRVSVERADGYARLTIADTGVGIAPDELPHIFERFRRVEGTRARTVEGSGIGLALVQELIRFHGGSVTVTSDVGQGTSFAVDIPFGTTHLPSDRVRDASSAVDAALAAAPFVDEALRLLPPEHTTNLSNIEADGALDGGVAAAKLDVDDERARVLVVDDNADMRSYLLDLLGSRYEVQVATDGLEALECVRRDPPALIVSDVMMPRLDGFGLVKALRADPLTSSIPIVLLSARAGEESTLEGLAGGADDYLVKPFSARELLARVRAHLQFSKALRLERTRLVTLFQQSPSFLAVLKGPDHVFEVANDAYLTLVGHREILGKPLLGALPELAGQGFKELLDGVYNSGEMYVGREVRASLARTPGAAPEEAYVNFVYHPIRQPDGTVSGVFVHGVDITSQVNARKQVEQLYESVKEANAAKQQFLAAMSHELRTPLNAVLGYTDLLALGVRGDVNEAQRTDIERIRSASQYLLTLINDILNFSRVEAGQLDLHLATIGVERVLHSARELILPHVDRQRLHLELVPLDPAIAVVADPERLQQIVLNILVNAVKFTPAGGGIRLSAEASDDRVWIHIEDTGRGIAPDQLQRIFEPFVQADRAASLGSQKGLGLGLAISRELARRMSGDVTVVSEPGRGSRFTVILPRAEAAI
jgi:signal transduction histidine kinase